MRKKNYTLLIILAAFLCISACGKKEDTAAEETCQHEWIDATLEAPKTCTLCGETEGEPLTCTHDWQEATFHTPKTCLICGEIEGDVKPNYFEEKNVPVDPEPTDYDGHAIVVGRNDKNYSYQTPCEYGIEDYSREKQDDGSEIINLVVTAAFDVCFEYTEDQQLLYSWASDLYDLYTGLELNFGDSFENEGFDESVTITVDDKEYVIEYSSNNEWWRSDYWYDDHSSNQHVKCTKTLAFHVPEGYDGLVFAFLDKSGYNPDSDDDDDEEYYFDPDLNNWETVDGYHLFRVNPPLPEEEETSEADENALVESETVKNNNENTDDSYSQEFSGDGFARDFTLGKYDSGIDFTGKEDKLEALGWTVNPYQKDFKSFDSINDKGWHVQLTPEICVYNAFDSKNQVVYTYQWDIGILTASGDGLFHEYFLAETDAENTCTPKEIEILMEIKKEAEALYAKVK